MKGDQIMNKPGIKQYSRRTFSAPAIVIALAIGALCALPRAQADQPVPVSASSTDCEHVISQESSGPNTIITLSITACFHGTFEGTWVGTERDVIRDGHGTGQGSGVFTGTVNGRSGTMVLSYHVSISPNGTVARWMVNQGTGELAGFSGQGTQQLVSQNGPGCPTSGFDCENCPPPTGTCDDSFTLNYDGQIQFAPEELILSAEIGAGPEAERDVGEAMAKNPVPLIIPCHRVLAAGGKLGGFSAPGGSATKQRMLEMEGVQLEPRKPAQQTLGL
jgi:O-6-methylguanine DNA methyltransferase